MPPKRTPLQHFNPVKSQAIDLLTDVDFPHTEDRLPDLDIDASNMAVEKVAPVLAGRRRGSEISTPGSSDDEPGAQGEHVLSAPHAVAIQGAVVQRSPVSNRDRFMAGFLPARSCCNLDLVRAPPGSKFSLTGICIAVFPAASNPDRRYIQLADITGTVGATVWNSNVHKFSNASVGALVSLNKVSISSHHGKKQLTLSRDSVVEMPSDPLHNVSQWWQQLLTASPKTCGTVHDALDNDIITVSGICGHVTSDAKMVNGVERNLTSIHLVDSSGRLDIRSWNHCSDTFLQYVDRPILIKRVRVTSFAGTKLCEILDGSGSLIETEFPGKVALTKFWAM
jgi:hypothetical protein